VRNMVMQQFRAAPESRARWDAIPYPFGIESFSDLVRHALNRLYRELVTEANQPGAFQRVKRGECSTCHEQGIVDNDGQCFVCWARCNQQPEERPAPEPCEAPRPEKKLRAPKRPRTTPPAKPGANGRKAGKKVK